LLGYASIKEGFTVGSNWTVSTSGIVNSFHATDDRGGFDYGGAIVFQNHDNKIGNYTFTLAYTRYTAWLAVGIEFPFQNNK
jgi:hypothetical protein